jgi:hypothetical protein
MTAAHSPRRDKADLVILELVRPTTVASGIVQRR